MVIDPKSLAIHDEVVVETEIDGTFASLLCFVTNVLQDELWLALRLPDARLLSLVDGQRVHLTFDRGGSLIVESEFLRRLGSHNNRLGGEKSRVFAVRRPQGVENVQRRAHVRVDLERAVRIKSFGSLGDAIGTGRTVNIAAGGVQFTTTMPLKFGDQLKVALVLTPRDIVVAGGPIVRIEEIPAPVPPGAEPPATPEMLTRVALRFDKITEVDQERIACYILAAHRGRAALPEPAPPAFPEPAGTPTAPASPAANAAPAAAPAPEATRMAKPAPAGGAGDAAGSTA